MLGVTSGDCMGSPGPLPHPVILAPAQQGRFANRPCSRSQRTRLLRGGLSNGPADGAQHDTAWLVVITQGH